MGGGGGAGDMLALNTLVRSSYELQIQRCDGAVIQGSGTKGRGGGEGVWFD